jgi:exodeoxyribonuclease V alpha subunit
MQLEATLKNVTYHNAQNGFSVLRCEVPGETGVVTVTGNFPELQPGESMRLEGEWASHPKFGKQFAATHCEPVIPSGGAGLVAYMSSGLFKGMGKTTATKIVELWGERTLEILDQHPEQLKGAIRGFTGKRLDAFLTSWKAMRESRETLLFLYSHQITGSTALRLWQQYGLNTIATINQNPYMLCQEVWGIGFTKADDIALKLGIPRDSLPRLQAGLFYALEKASREGHTYLPRPQLLEQTVDLLKVHEHDDVFDRLLLCLEDLVQEGGLLQHADGIWLPALYRAEDVVSRFVRTAISSAPSSSKKKLPKNDTTVLLHEFESDKSLQYSPEQFQGICAAVENRLYIITGGPGTGKTTTLQGILHLCAARKETVLLAAPTGRAARRMSELCRREASTLHRLLEINPSTRVFERNEQRPLEADCIVVDEFSMVDTWIAAALVRALSSHTRLLLMGDHDQLPSVGPGSILRELLSCPKVPSMRLTRIYRQGDGSDIAENAHRINQGHRPNLHSGSHFHFIPYNNPAEALALVDKVVSNDIAGRLEIPPVRELQVLTPMHRGPLGTQALNAHLQGLLNNRLGGFSLFGTHWKVGDRVMQLKNNYDKNIFNGDIGFVLMADKDEQRLEIDFDGRRIALEGPELDQLSLAYACTVHKSQGSEYSAVILVLDPTHSIMLQRNLLYTAITRAKGHVWILAGPGALDTAVRNNRTVRRYTRLAESIRAGETFLEWLEE